MSDSDGEALSKTQLYEVRTRSEAARVIAYDTSTWAALYGGEGVSVG